MVEKQPKEEEYFELSKIRALLELSDSHLFPIYLKEVYKDLIDRAESDKQKGVSRVTFYEYIRLPIFMAEKLFNALDKDNDSSLSLREFVEGLNNLYYGSFNQSAKVIFNMYDFDKDNKINKEDIKILFSYLPLKDENRQQESLKEIDVILANIGSENNFKIDKFMDIIKKKSDLYIQIYCYLIECKPYVIESVEACKNLPKYKEMLKTKEKDGSKMMDEFINEKVFLSPIKVNSHFKPYNQVIDICVPEWNIDEDDGDENTIKPLTQLKHNDVKISKSELKMQNEMIRVTNRPGNKFETPTTFLRKAPEDPELMDLDLDGGKTSGELGKKRKNTGGLVRKKSMNLVQQKGTIYKITDNNNLKTFFLLLCNKDVYYYKDERCDELLGMHNLSGCYISEPDNTPLTKNGKTLYSFSLIFSNRTRTYYCDNLEERDEWLISIKNGIGYLSFNDKYEIKERIDGGKFGDVYLGIHKSTKAEVAIKTIKKESMTIKDMELVKGEIDIMKICKHPNIVRLLDHYENKQYTFIVMEYLKGGTLANYLENTPVDDLSEKDTGKIAYQIAKALEYLHQFGIVHRDLKPENIMLKYDLPHKEPDSLKLMDFGLSKILGPNEKVNDGYGTLTYVAPEVLTRKPYNKQVDIWSLGTIVYYTLSGTFPFDDQSNDEEVIAKKIVFQELQFYHKSWPSRSASAKDFINKTMIKDLDKRAKIGEIMKHPWFVECDCIQKTKK